MNSKKILIFGPIGNHGGRELESGFIASVLSSKHEVVICSTGKISSNSQVFDFNKNQKVLSIKELLFQRFFFLKLFAFLSFFKNGCKGKESDCVNNAFAKRFLNYEQKRLIVLDHLIADYNAVFLVAQLSSDLIDVIIRIAKNKNKKVFFRTTGAITSSDYNFIDSVDCFIHHSQKNAEKLEMHKHYKFAIIDQCVFNEENFLKLSPVNNRIKSFLTVARLEKEKNIDIVIKAFLKVKSEGDVLYVLGTGSELPNLKIIAKEDKAIVFTGFVDNDKLYTYFSMVDCVIISHYDLETGPLTGIEAMASARILISAKTGAMFERLEGVDSFWFENSVECLSNEIIKVKKMSEENVLDLSKTIRNRYLQHYTKNEIASKYLEVVSNLMNLCD